MALSSSTPRVTIITSTYNWSSVLPYAIASAQRQTFTDWEMLIVGDGCTDDSEEVVARASGGDARIRWINLPENNGEQSAPNNEGLRQARGELIAYLGHDDLWLPHHLQLLVDSIDGGADLAYSLIEFIFGPEVVPPERLNAESILPSSVLHRKTVTDAVGGWTHYREIYDTPQQHLWDSAKRAGFKFERVPRLSVIKFSAACRRDSYKIRSCEEQAHWTQRIENEPDFEIVEMTKMALELRRIHIENISMSFRQKLLRFLRDLPAKLKTRLRERSKKRYKGHITDEYRLYKGLDIK
jgi:glycosyltransferase involved in cell wall biosynthesis